MFCVPAVPARPPGNPTAKVRIFTDTTKFKVLKNIKRKKFFILAIINKNNLEI